MIKNGKGGANTNKTGLKAEDRIGLLINNNFHPSHFLVGQKSQIYNYKNLGLIPNENILKETNYKPQPDLFVFNLKNKKLWIIEIKNQDISGSVCEKIEMGIYGYKADIFKRIFTKNELNIDGIYCGSYWEKIKYLPDIKKYIKRTYSKKFYSEEEVDELIAMIKKNIQ